VVDAAPAATRQPAGQALLIRAEVLLDRAHFSPGVIDGRSGSNLRRALNAYQQAHGLPVTGRLDAATWQSLVAADAAPVTQDYVITQADVAGPFTATPTRMEDMARMDHLSYATPREELAERFHMDERLLAALNPHADFASAGTRILVVQPSTAALPTGIARLEVDKSANQVRAYGEGDRLIAAFPATVGSTERPAPTGDVTIRAVAPNPTYTYDPSRLTFGHRSGGRLTIPAGPNNPVGATWIDLSQDTYGIHGTPDPADVGKTASHGCVRLTNWDAAALGRAVHAGMRVSFVGAETR
jgi:lipoprotein-anchoring transpeptidase ErfK/SrfK